MLRNSARRLRPVVCSGNDVQQRSMSIFKKVKDFFVHAPDLQPSQAQLPATTFRAKAPATITQGEVRATNISKLSQKCSCFPNFAFSMKVTKRCHVDCLMRCNLFAQHPVIPQGPEGRQYDMKYYESKFPKVCMHF
jgi:hypothetical protein